MKFLRYFIFACLNICNLNCTILLHYWCSFFFFFSVLTFNINAIFSFFFGMYILVCCHNGVESEKNYLRGWSLRPVQVFKKKLFMYNSSTTLKILKIHINTSYYNTTLTVIHQVFLLVSNTISTLLIYYE